MKNNLRMEIKYESILHMFNSLGMRRKKTTERNSFKQSKQKPTVQ